MRCFIRSPSSEPVVRVRAPGLFDVVGSDFWYRQPPLHSLDKVQLAAGLLGPLPRFRPVEDVLVVDFPGHLAVALGVPHLEIEGPLRRRAFWIYLSQFHQVLLEEFLFFSCHSCPPVQVPSPNFSGTASTACWAKRRFYAGIAASSLALCWNVNPTWSMRGLFL